MSLLYRQYRLQKHTYNYHSFNIDIEFRIKDQLSTPRLIKNLPITYIESSTTIAPAHLLASSILGPVFHCLCSQSYFVTRLTVRDPVGELGSDSSPPKMNQNGNFRFYRRI